MTPRLIVKRAAQGCALALVFPCALVCGFGRLWPVYMICAHGLALLPGIIGNLVRGAFYKLTLRDCSIDTNIGFGTFFVHPDSSVGPRVSIGCYCVIGRASIGRGTQIASHVGIPGGRHQHARDADGRLGGTVSGKTTIGEYCWIGESAVVLGDVGARATIGAGAVVVEDIPAGVVAVGNPARVVRAART
jgi:acetyltransferase-like isoleucine patch superfamily enzyme